MPLDLNGGWRPVLDGPPPIMVLDGPPPVQPGQGPGLFPAESEYQTELETEKRIRGWSAISNKAPSPKDPVPILYGKQRVKPAMINGHVVPLDDGSERLKLLFAIGEGPLYKIGGLTEDVDNLTDLSAIGDKIRLNGQPITDFEEVKVSVRMGDADQKFVRGFTNLHNEIAVGRELDFGEPDDPDQSSPKVGFTTTDGTDIDAVRLHFTVGDLWSQVAETQEYAAKTVEVRVKYRPYTPSGQPNQEWKDGGLLSVTENLQGTTRRAHKVEFDTPGRWDLRVVKKTPDSFEGVRATDITWLSVDEIQESTETYQNTGLLAIKVKNTEDLSGSTPTVDVLIHGIMVAAPTQNSGAVDYDDTYWDDVAGTYKQIGGSAVTTGARSVQWTRNPVWCLYDLLTNARYGGGLRITAVDINETPLNIAAKFCHELVDRYEDPSTQEHRCRLDIIFDARIKLSDGVKHILNTFRGVIFESGQIIIRVDKAEAPSQFFTGGNTLQGSFSHAWPALSQIHNRVEVSYRNEDDDYEERSVAATEDVSPEKIRIGYARGITRRSQALRNARYLLLCESRQKQRVSQKNATDALSCQAFDVVGIANLVPAWGTSNGAVTEINIGAKWFKMNRDVTLNVLGSGAAYYVNVRTGTTQDAIDNLIIASSAGEYPAGTEIYTTTAFDASTIVGSPVSVGELNVVVKPFRITRITHRPDGTTIMDLLEYDAAVYSDSGPADEQVNYSTLPVPSLFPEPVSNVNAVNSPGAKNSTVNVSWTRPALITETATSPIYGSWAHAEIHVSPDGGGNYIKFGTSAGNSFQIDGLVPGATYIIKVVSVSGWGLVNPLSGALPISITVKTGAPPPNVTGLTLRGQGNDSEFVGRDPVFQWKAASGSSAYGLLGPLGGGNISKDANARWYQVQIWSDGILRREEVVDKTEFVYAYEKNRNDHAGIARRGFEVRVWALDQNNTPSALPATLAVTNPLSAQPTGFGVTSSFQYFFVSWDESPEPDSAGFVVRRSLPQGASGFSTAWVDMTTVQIGPETSFTDLSPTDVTGTVFYYRAAAYDTFDNVNELDGFGNFTAAALAAQDALLATAADSDTIGTIPVTDIDDFGAEKIFQGIPILQGQAWTGNSPAATRAAWNEHFLYFSNQVPTGLNSNTYTIAAGNTPVTADPTPIAQYIWWRIGESSYRVTTEHPGNPAVEGDPSLFEDEIALGADFPGGFLIAVNRLGVITPAWNAIANMAIGSAYMANAAITNAKIANLAVDDAKIANLAVTNAKIALLAVQNANILDLHGEKITADTISANQIKVGNRNITAEGLVFTLDKKDKDGESGIPEITWTDGTLKYPGGTVAVPTIESRPLDAGGPITWPSGTLYFYYDTLAGGPSTTILSTADTATALNEDNIRLATYQGGNTLIIHIGGTTITGDEITTGTINANTLNVENINAGNIVSNDGDAYVAGTTYSIGDLATYGGKLYISTENGNQGNQPDISSEWNLVGTTSYLEPTVIAEGTLYMITGPETPIIENMYGPQVLSADSPETDFEETSYLHNAPETLIYIQLGWQRKYANAFDDTGFNFYINGVLKWSMTESGTEAIAAGTPLNQYRETQESETIDVSAYGTESLTLKIEATADAFLGSSCECKAGAFAPNDITLIGISMFKQIVSTNYHP